MPGIDDAPLMKSPLQEAGDLENKAAELEKLAEHYDQKAIDEDRKLGPLDYMFDPAGIGKPDAQAKEAREEAMKYREEARQLQKEAAALRKTIEDAGEGAGETGSGGESPIESVLPDLGKGSDAPPIESVLPDIGKESYRTPAPNQKTLLAAGAVAMVLALGAFALFRGDGDSSVTPDGPAPAAAVIGADGSYEHDGTKYYRVVSDDPSGDTGNEVCARVGKTCVGYTALTQAVCLAFHPGATPSEDFNGSKAGFYCNGAPQGGICGQESNTCHICPKCNLNMECDTVIGDLYRETFVECK